jgi:phosphoglycerate dehydrogenase-like enzyme
MTADVVRVTDYAWPSLDIERELHPVGVRVVLGVGHTMALILESARRVCELDRQTREGGWDNQATGPIHRLRGQTLGFVGYGRVGRAVAARARAFVVDFAALSNALAAGTIRGAAVDVLPVEPAPAGWLRDRPANLVVPRLPLGRR